MALLIRRGTSHLELGEVDEALADYKAAAQADPHSNLPHHALGIALIGQGRYNEAHTSFSRALQIKATAELFVERAKTNVMLKRLEEALNDCTAALKLEPEYLNALLLSMETTYRMGKFAQCEALCEQIFKLSPNNDKALFFRSQCHSVAKRYQKSLEDLEQCVAVGFKTDAVYINKALAFIYLERFEEALVDIQVALKLNPVNEKAWSNQATILSKLDRHKEAIESSYKALELAKEDERKSKIFHNNGIMYNRLNDPENALKANLSAIALDTNFAAAYNNRACILAHLGRFSEADQDIQRAMRLEPDNVTILGSRGFIDYCLERYDQTIEGLTKCVALNPKDRESHYFLGLALKKRGNEEDAAKHIAEAEALEYKLPLYSVFRT